MSCSITAIECAFTVLSVKRLGTMKAPLYADVSGVQQPMSHLTAAAEHTWPMHLLVAAFNHVWKPIPYALCDAMSMLPSAE